MSSECHPFRSDATRSRYLQHYATWESAWPVEWTATTVCTEYGETYVRISGPSNAPPLVLLPGGRAPSLCWDSMIEGLAAHFHTYAIDAVYDVGRSVDSRRVATASDVSTWLDNVMDGLGLTEGVNLMGLSLGGWAVAEYSSRSPQRLAKTVWLSPAAVSCPISPAFIRRSLACMIPTAFNFRYFTRWIMPYLAAAEDRRPFDNVVRDLVISSRCFKIRPFPGGPRELTSAELQRIDVPVLYLVGDQDRACPDVARAVSRVQSLVTHAEVTVKQDAGHDLWMMHPAEVCERVTAYLTGLARPSDGLNLTSAASEVV